MKIKVKCFSIIKYALGSEIILDMKKGITSSDLELEIRRLGQGKFDKLKFGTAVNKTYISSPVELHDGDEVAFIPPVQGG